MSEEVYRKPTNYTPGIKRERREVYPSVKSKNRSRAEMPKADMENLKKLSDAAFEAGHTPRPGPSHQDRAEMDRILGEISTVRKTRLTKEEKVIIALENGWRIADIMSHYKVPYKMVKDAKDTL